MSITNLVVVGVTGRLPAVGRMLRRQPFSELSAVIGAESSGIKRRTAAGPP
ncbi:hypothetical protein [Metapseudomonas boanensis]|uniref:Uncharacterized protein n=1 Tax=Metapseudomonas boanensis TaxID=2822138 RepID=A0ABS5XIC4_9GAMM|nr:hypothetical protein [Pseudomonas boanensis]MBT8767437.1 hypothetical protein [Pseudomonas boanensis]